MMMAVPTASRRLVTAAVSLAGGIVRPPSCKSTLLCPTLAGRCRSQFSISPQRKFSSSTSHCNKGSHPAPLVAPVKGKKRLNLELDGSFITFDYLFLRDACSCPQCVHPSTRQKLFQTTDIPYDIYPAVVETLGDGTLRIQWADDILTAGDATHESHYSPDFLRRYSTLRNRVRSRFNDQRQILWAGKQMERHVLWVDYSDYMSNDGTLFRAVKQLSSYGLVFIRGIPEAQENAIEGVAERIGNLKTTFYGKTWDVKSAKGSKNIAYTSLNLGHHMDLLYFESPPGLQFLHCIQNTVEGGSSLFADSFRAATVVRLDTPTLFEALTKYPVTYHYQNDGYHYHFTRPTVVLEEHSYQGIKRIRHVNWAPPFQAPFEADIGESAGRFRQYILAAKQFAKQVDSPDAQFELRLAEGECVVFFNRRVLHSRKAFNPDTGDRWLKGAYVDIDAFHSKFRTLSAQHQASRTIPDSDEDAYSYIR